MVRSGELSDAEGINIRNIPILVSVVKVRFAIAYTCRFVHICILTYIHIIYVQVGSTFLVDASGAELACSSGVFIAL
jgi:hypothetical protein